MADFNELALYIASLQDECRKAKEKAEFFGSQYEKYREQHPDVASCHKLQMEFEEDKVRLVKGHIGEFEELLRHLESQA